LNTIGAEGARHLAQALQHNTVTLQLLSLLYQTSLFNPYLDTYTTRPFPEFD